MTDYNAGITEAERHLFVSSLFGGGAAGLVVDVVLYPLDTIKTRLQSAQGFAKAGGFKSVYKGLGAQVIGSAPQAALFFVTYEAFKHYVEPMVPRHSLPLVHMVGASIGEVMACFVRVPVEIAKQRRQISSKYSSLRILIDAYKTEGIIKGLYRGFGSTVVRDLPFSFIQLPILEYLQTTYRTKFKNNISLESWEVANCGAISGGISAAITTPLDVIKTRIMLACRKRAHEMTMKRVFMSLYKEEGIQGLFSGFVPRVLWITIGGYIFFGIYDFSKNLCKEYLLNQDYDLPWTEGVDDE